MDEHILPFLESLQLERNASRSTLEAYEKDLRQFIQFLESRPLQEITPTDLQIFTEVLHARKLKPSSIHRKLSALRQFFKFCCLEGTLKETPAEGLISPHAPTSLPKSLSLEEVEALLATCAQGLPYPGPRALAQRLRDQTIVTLLYASGLRVSEVLGLTLNQLVLSEGFLRVKGKGEKERVVPIAPVASHILSDYLDQARLQLCPLSTDYVFPNSRGNPLTRQGFWKTLGKLALQAGIHQTVSPHVLRHSFATHLLQSGMNLRVLQSLLGHADLSTTQIYTQVDSPHLKRTHRKFHPRG